MRGIQKPNERLDLGAWAKPYPLKPSACMSHSWTPRGWRDGSERRAQDWVLKGEIMSNTDGGPAFPNVTHSQVGHGVRQDVTGGMSLRDWFAGQALAGLMQTMTEKRQEAMNNGECDAAWEASLAYKAADAMLAARGGDDAESL